MTLCFPSQADTKNNEPRKSQEHGDPLRSPSSHLHRSLFHQDRFVGVHEDVETIGLGVGSSTSKRWARSGDIGLQLLPWSFCMMSRKTTGKALFSVPSPQNVNTMLRKTQDMHWYLQSSPNYFETVKVVEACEIWRGRSMILIQDPLFNKELERIVAQRQGKFGFQVATTKDCTKALGSWIPSPGVWRPVQGVASSLVSLNEGFLATRRQPMSKDVKRRNPNLVLLGQDLFHWVTPSDRCGSCLEATTTQCGNCWMLLVRIWKHL